MLRNRHLLSGSSLPHYIRCRLSVSHTFLSDPLLQPKYIILPTTWSDRKMATPRYPGHSYAQTSHISFNQYNQPYSPAPSEYENPSYFHQRTTNLQNNGP